MDYKDESDDYKRGFQDAVREMHALDDELKLMDRMFGKLTDEDLSPRLLQKFKEWESSASLPGYHFAPPSINAHEG